MGGMGLQSSWIEITFWGREVGVRLIVFGLVLVQGGMLSVSLGKVVGIHCVFV